MLWQFQSGRKFSPYAVAVYSVQDTHDCSIVWVGPLTG